MGNIFANKKAAKNDKVEEDFVGGGGVLTTDIYGGKIKYAYLGKAANSDARNVTLSVVFGSKEVRQTIWMTNRDGEVTYTDKKTKEEKNLPGYNQINSLCMMLLGKEIGELDVEDKTLNLYDFESKKEVPTSVECFVDLHGLELQAAVQEQIVDKEAKNDKGVYEPTGETRKQNEFIKFFPAEKTVTLSEIAHFVESIGGTFDDVLKEGDLDKAIDKIDEEAGVWAKAWLEKNRGEAYDKSKGAKKEGKSFGNKSSGGGEEKAKPSLFDD